MIIGFKTGPRSWEEGKLIVDQEGGAMCEVWFDYNLAGEYDEMFEWLQSRNVGIALHYWGVAKGNIKPNLATHHAEVRDEIMEQIKRTIDIGSSINCAYVNIHPGARRLEIIDFANQRQSLTDHEVTPPDQAAQLVTNGALELHQYAVDKNVILTVESLPGREAQNFGTRGDLYDSGNTTLETMAKMGQAGVYLANDITHTAGALAMAVDSDDEIWPGLYDYSQATSAATKLVHLNTLMPPHNGADTHDGIRDEDFEAGVWPAKDQVLDILKLFSDRDDVHVVLEPRQHMQENYRALVSMVSSI